jgi:polyisoprenoid-binding protein YceI
MKRIIIMAVVVHLFGFNITAQEKLKADISGTQLIWQGETATGKHSGTIRLQSGWLEWKDNKIVSGEFDIDMKSIKNSENTRGLDGHLMSDKFFSSESFPVSKLVITGSTSFKKGTSVVKGLMTIKDVTNAVEFESTVEKKEEGLLFYADIKVDRTKYNIRYGSGKFFSNLGDMMIYDEFDVKINLLVN